MAGDPAVLSWYAAPPSDILAHARRRLAHLPPSMQPAEVEEWRSFLVPFSPHPATTQSLQRIAQPGTLAVVTGQQAGLFGGPLYSLYKAAAAVLWARRLESELGTPVVPIFWVASDDHDFAEVAVHHWLDGQGKLRTWRAGERSEESGASIFHRRFEPADVQAFLEEFESSTPGGDFHGELLQSLNQSTAAPGVTWESQFVGTLLRWLGATGILPVVPRLSWLRRRAAPLMKSEIEARGETARIVKSAGERLAALGADVGLLHRSGTEANFFLDLGGVRAKVKWKNASVAELSHPVTNDLLKSMSPQELMGLLAAEPESFSPNAALRPLVQDAALPTVAYIGGPSEVMYHAQIGGLYSHFNVFRPIVIPRPGLMLVEARIKRLCEKLGVQLNELKTSGADALRAAVARSGDGAAFKAGLEADLAVADEAVKRIEAFVLERSNDTGLVKAAEKMRQGLETGREKIFERLDAWLQRRDGDRGSQADRILDALWPCGEPQERVLGWLSPLLRNWGEDGVIRLVEELDIDSTETKWVEL